MGLLQEHQAREKIVFEFLNKIVLDCSVVYLKEDGKFSIPMRIQLIATFSLLDVLTNFYYEYNGLPSSSQQNRFLIWVKKYCLVPNNPEFVSHKAWSRITAESLYSAEGVHSYIFSGFLQKVGTRILVLQINHIKELDKVEAEFLKKGSKTIIFRPHDLHELVKQGGMIMLKDWMNVLNENKNDITIINPHIMGIERLMKKIDLDGAFPE